MLIEPYGVSSLSNYKITGRSIHRRPQGGGGARGALAPSPDFGWALFI